MRDASSAAISDFALDMPDEVDAAHVCFKAGASAPPEAPRRNVRHAPVALACNGQHARCNVQRATGNMQRARRNLQRARRNMHGATCNVRGATCTVQHATCAAQHATGAVQLTTGAVGAAQPRACAKALGRRVCVASCSQYSPESSSARCAELQMSSFLFAWSTLHVACGERCPSHKVGLSLIGGACCPV
jgi:hypothetical protein